MHDRQRPPNPFSTAFIRPGTLAPRQAAGSEPLAPVDLPAFAQQIASLRHAAIVGPHGSGKTTLLRHLTPALEAYSGAPVTSVMLRSGESTAAAGEAAMALPRGGWLVIDGYEQLGWLARRWLLWRSRRRGLHLLITSHREEPGWTTVWRTTTSEPLARQLAEELLSDDPEARPAMLAALERHWPESGGDLRQLWFALYDEYERWRPS